MRSLGLTDGGGCMALPLKPLHIQISSFPIQPDQEIQMGWSSG